MNFLRKLMPSPNVRDDEHAQGPLVLLVGHCGFDAGSIRAAVLRAEPAARVEQANVQDELVTRLSSADLLLINRVLDGQFETTSGIEFLRWIDTAELSNKPSRMLVSNLPAAQEEARSVGAQPGFGKDDLNSPETLERIHAALAQRGKPGA